jgi:hypothetical protein
MRPIRFLFDFGIFSSMAHAAEGNETVVIGPVSEAVGKVDTICQTCRAVTSS